MDFRIDSKSKEKLDMMIYGYVRTQKEAEEKYKKEIKEKQTRHLEKYHFKSFDEIKNYLLDGHILYPDKSFDNIILDGQEIENIYFEGMIEFDDGEMEENMLTCVLTNGDRISFPLDDFEKEFFFTLMSG